MKAEASVWTGSVLLTCIPASGIPDISSNEAIVKCDAFWKDVDAEISVHKYHCQKESGLLRLPGSQRFTKTVKF